MTPAGRRSTSSGVRSRTAADGLARARALIAGPRRAVRDLDPRRAARSRGSDEFDHAYRAAAAARGQWAIDPVERHPRHRRLPDRARPTSSRRPGPSARTSATPRTTTASASAQVDDQTVRRERRRPLPPALLRRDRHAGQAVRRQPPRCTRCGSPPHSLAGAFVWARRTRGLAPGRRTRWPYSASPWPALRSRIYSSTIAAPNGVEMMAALALWMSLIGLLLARPEHDPGTGGLIAAVSGAALATLRPLGPAVVPADRSARCCVAVRADQDARPRAPAPPRECWPGGLVVLLSALQSTAWVLAMDALKMGGGGTGRHQPGLPTRVSAPARSRSGSSRPSPRSRSATSHALRRLRLLPDPVRRRRDRSACAPAAPAPGSPSPSSSALGAAVPLRDDRQHVRPVRHRLAGTLRPARRDGDRGPRSPASLDRSGRHLRGPMRWRSSCCSSSPRP